MHGDIVPDKIVNQFTIAGTVEEYREQVSRLKEAGLDQIAIFRTTPRAWVVKVIAAGVFAKS